MKPKEGWKYLGLLDRRPPWTEYLGPMTRLDFSHQRAGKRKSCFAPASSDTIGRDRVRAVALGRVARSPTGTTIFPFSLAASSLGVLTYQSVFQQYSSFSLSHGNSTAAFTSLQQFKSHCIYCTLKTKQTLLISH